MACDSVLDGQLGVSQVKADADLARTVEERLRRGVGHLALKVRVDVVLPVEIPMREECGERTFRKYHDVATMRPGLPHERDEASDRVRAGVGARDRSKLCRRDGDDARH